MINTYGCKLSHSLNLEPDPNQPGPGDPPPQVPPTEPPPQVPAGGVRV